MRLFLAYLAIGFGGFLGAMARFLVATESARRLGSGFPIGTLLINVVGSFCLGCFLGLRIPMSEYLRVGVAVGFLGAFTTFSTLCFETDALVQDGSLIKAMGNIIVSVVLGLLAIRFGMIVGQWISTLGNFHGSGR